MNRWMKEVTGEVWLTRGVNLKPRCHMWGRLPQPSRSSQVFPGLGHHPQAISIGPSGEERGSTIEKEPPKLSHEHLLVQQRPEWIFQKLLRQMKPVSIESAAVPPTPQFPRSSTSCIQKDIFTWTGIWLVSKVLFNRWAQQLVSNSPKWHSHSGFVTTN